MKLNNRAQIFIVDFLFAIIIIFLIFILISNWAEHSIYKSISERELKELEFVGHSVFEKIMNDPEYLCYVEVNDSKSYISGCLKGDLVLKKKNIGLPSNYNCSISPKDLFQFNECDDVVPDNAQVYEIDVDVLHISKGKISTTEYNDFFIDESILDSSLNLKVWKE